MKLIAYYLPQFHEIEINNKAWGKGFTEWTNVKKALPLFEGHNQPRIPLNDNYYNLLDVNILIWQVSLAKKYGIHGFCYYHYWFQDGIQALEKPAEILLEHKEIDFPFCFSWANEPWTRTWHGAKGEKEVLIEQRYGDRAEWKAHFDYLLPFFLDDRYIKIDEKPVLLIYQINKIGCISKMLDYWNELAIENGISGFYVIDMLTADGKVCKNKRVSASADFEPGKDLRRISAGGKKLSYDDICCSMLWAAHKKNEYRCMFVDYDDTPRRNEKGTVFFGTSPEKFGKYLQKAIKLSEEEGNNILFINAWNEWGEGNYLEPDTKNAYAYLEQVYAAKNEMCEDVFANEVMIKDSIVKKNGDIEKYNKYYTLCNQWIKNINDHYSIETYFQEKGYQKIAIYGMGELGNRLVESLIDSDIQIIYGIDRDTSIAFAEINIIGIDEVDKLEGVDCIVVTSIHVYEQIAEILKKKSNCDIISLEDVVFGL